MSTFNSLSYATQLVATGLPREQAEVHANALQKYAFSEHILSWPSIRSSD